MKIVVVTGASSGIGLASAVRLAGAGWRVFGGVRTEADASALRERGIEPLELDVTDAAQIAAAADAVGPTLDGLVDNAGIAIAAPLELVPLDELRHQLEVNVVGQVAVAQAFLPALRRARGRVVLMGSIGGKSALPFLGPYAASKHALEAVADSLRVELRPWGIEVAIVEPASIATPSGRRGLRVRTSCGRASRRDVAEFYAPAVASFRKVALARGPGADAGRGREGRRARAHVGSSEGSLPRRPGRASARVDRATADAAARPRARESADALAALRRRGRRSRATRGRSAASRARPAGAPGPSSVSSYSTRGGDSG